MIAELVEFERAVRVADAAFNDRYDEDAPISVRLALFDAYLDAVEAALRKLDGERLEAARYLAQQAGPPQVDV